MLYLIVQNIERNQNEDPDFYNMDAISPLPSSWKSEDNKSGTVIYSMAQQTRPRMKTNNENIDIFSIIFLSMLTLRITLMMKVII